jgi:chemotaxis protein CheD
MAEYIGNEFTYLLPGEMIVTVESLKISTILGSCVSVCLFDQANRIAGMNHYLLPYNKENDLVHFRYGNESLDYMLIQMLKMGANMHQMVASVYGGSSMFQDTLHSYNIGEKNIEIAVRFLKEKGLSIKHSETGGTVGRKIVFDTNTGVISSSFLQSQGNKTNIYR